MAWQFENGQPIYLQLSSELKKRIVRGLYGPGSRFPAVRELAMEAGVNPNTVQRALSQLETEELLFTQRTSGRFVTEDVYKIARLREELARQYIRELWEKLEGLGMNAQEIENALKSAAETGLIPGGPGQEGGETT